MYQLLRCLTTRGLDTMNTNVQKPHVPFVKGVVTITVPFTAKIPNKLNVEKIMSKSNRWSLEKLKKAINNTTYFDAKKCTNESQNFPSLNQKPTNKKPEYKAMATKWHDVSLITTITIFHPLQDELHIRQFSLVIQKPRSKKRNEDNSIDNLL